MTTSLRVAVIGVGTIGAQALDALSRRGVEVHGYERFDLGHANGAGGGEGRIMRRVLGRDEAFWPLIDRAQDLWSRIEQESGRRIIDYTGALAVGHSTSATIARVSAEAAVRDLPLEALDAAQLRRRFGFQAVDDDDVGLLDPRGGMIRSELANLLTARLAQERGALVRTGTVVTAVRETPGSVEVVTDQGSATYDQVVITTGAWARELAPDLEARLSVHKPVSAWFASRSPDPLVDAPVFTRSDPMQYYGIPTADGRLVKLGFGGTRQTRIAQAPRPEDYFVSSAELASFAEIVERFFPSLHPEPVRVNAYFEGYTPDAHPIVERSSPRITTAVGFSGDGFKLAPVYGEMVADLAQGVGAAPPFAAARAPR